MPIKSVLKDRTFDPDAIAVMEGAYACVLVTLGITNRDDPVTRLISEKIIGLFEDGVTNQAQLYKLTVAAFQEPQLGAKH